jgi:hypothetical protein
MVSRGLGSIEIRSGLWGCLLVELVSGPEWTVSHRSLYFRDKGNPGNEMSVRLSLEWDDFSEDALKRLALEPSERRIEHGVGNIWILWPVDPGPEEPGGEPVRRAILHSPGFDRRVIDLPDNRPLGELLHLEIVAFI